MDPGIMDYVGTLFSPIIVHLLHPLFLLIRIF